MLAWGAPDDYSRAIKSGAAEYLEAVRAAEKCTARELAAAIRLVNISIRQQPLGLGAHRDVAAAALNELANLILSCSAIVPGCAHLVRGLWLRTDFDQLFELVVPSSEIEWGQETGGPDYRQFSVPSPFQLFIETADYAGALSIASACPEAFSSPGVRGWRAAASGFTDRTMAVEHFAQAAIEFAADVPPTGGLDPDRGAWTSRNIDLWAPYFRARSLLARVIREPLRAREYIRLASDLMPIGAAGWIDTEVQRFRALLACLRQLIDPEADTPIDAIRREFVGAAKLGGPMAGDPMVDRFISLVAELLVGFAEAPGEEITSGRLSDALALLDRLPLLEPGIAAAAKTAAGDRMLDVLLGPTSWIYESLEAIRDERQLQRLVLRLARTSFPISAQVIHGPLEHGKDVFAFVSDGAETQLRMYQVKAGPISTPVWRTAKAEMEAMFEVPLPEMVTGWGKPDRLVGRLVANGHAGMNVAPEMEGWFKTQRERLARDVDFLDIDGLVAWIRHDRLVNEYRAFLASEGLA